MVARLNVTDTCFDGDDEADHPGTTLSPTGIKLLPRRRRRTRGSNSQAAKASKLYPLQPGHPDFIDFSSGDDMRSAAKRQRTFKGHLRAGGSQSPQLDNLNSELDDDEQAGQGDIDDPSMYICVLYCGPTCGCVPVYDIVCPEVCTYICLPFAAVPLSFTTGLLQT